MLKLYHNLSWNILLKMFETRSMLKKGNTVWVIVMNISKTIDTLNHSLFLRKLKLYGFGKDVFTFIQSFFSNRHQSIKNGDEFNKRHKISAWVPQGPIIDSLFFKFFYQWSLSFYWYYFTLELFIWLYYVFCWQKS